MAMSPSRDSSQKVQAAIRRLRAAHKIGKQLFQACPFDRPDRQNTMVAEAKRHRVNLDTAYKLRVFAHEKKGYTGSELNTLCRLCEEHGRALGFTFVVKFLTIHNKTERTKFQEETIANGLSLIQVRLTLAARRGSQALHGLAGKRPKIRDLDDFLADVAGKCVWWQRLHKMLEDSFRDLSKGSTLSLADIPVDIRKPFKNAVQSIERLKDAVTVYLDASRRGAKGRPRADKSRGRGSQATASSRGKADVQNQIRRLAKIAVTHQRNASAGKTTDKSVSTAHQSKRHYRS